MENTSSEIHGDVRESSEVRLAAIYSVFDGVELLIGSMRSIKDGVDLFIIHYQDISNHGELYSPLAHLPVDEMDKEFKILWLKYEPAFSGLLDERIKRGQGINAARAQGCTHFLMIDCDEYYQPLEFVDAKKRFLESGADGSVLRLVTYFGDATLRQENPDNYYVPFIHKMNGDTTNNVVNYPFYVDPTRRINVKNVVLIESIFMHHYSWVRHDIELKARNSSAKKNIEKAGLLRDYYSAKEGSVVNGGNLLIKVPDYFGINDMIATFESV